MRVQERRRGEGRRGEDGGAEEKRGEERRGKKRGYQGDSFSSLASGLVLIEFYSAIAD